MSKWIDQLRIFNFVKNLIIALPVFIYYPAFEAEKFKIIFIAMFSFSMVASAVYLMNDILDIEKDKKHVGRSKRPLAQGLIQINQAWLVAVLLLAFGVGLSMLVDLTFFYILSLYALLNYLYSFKLKRMLYINIVLLVIFHLMRYFAGILIGHYPVDILSLLILSLVFLALATALHRDKLLKAFESSKLRAFYWVIAVSSLALFAIFIFVDTTKVNFPNFKFLIPLVPLLWFVYARVWKITHNSIEHSYRLIPIFTDKFIWLYSTLILIFAVSAKIGA